MASLDPWIKLSSSFRPPGCFTMDQMYGLKINDHQLFCPQAYGTEVNYYSFLDLSADNLSNQGHVPRIWNKGYSFRLMEWDFIENQAKVSESYTDCLAISISILGLHMRFIRYLPPFILFWDLLPCYPFQLYKEDIPLVWIVSVVLHAT